MRVLVSASARFVGTPDGSLWTANGSLGYHFWTRYLDVFDEVRLLVRAADVATRPEGWIEATGPGVSAVPLPNFAGVNGFAKERSQVRRIIADGLRTTQAVQLRVPCPVGEAVARVLPRDRPYGVEVVTDPYDVFAPGSVRHPLRPIFRWWFPRVLRGICQDACAAAYVTEHALQRRYPPSRAAFTTHFSSVELPTAAFVTTPREQPSNQGPMTLITVGTLEQLYKAPDVLLDAVGRCVLEGLDLRLVIVGSGKYRSELESRAASIGLKGRVRFAGQLSGSAAVRQELDRADLFVLPSRQEGLPRAMIEAMARGLPCIGSTVGGIPELLPPQDLVPPNDVAALAAMIRNVARDPARMVDMSTRNLATSRSYHQEVLRSRRMAFYTHLRDVTCSWLATQDRGSRVF